MVVIFAREGNREGRHPVNPRRHYVASLCHGRFCISSSPSLLDACVHCQTQRIKFFRDGWYLACNSTGALLTGMQQDRDIRKPNSTGSLRNSANGRDDCPETVKSAQPLECSRVFAADVRLPSRRVRSFQIARGTRTFRLFGNPFCHYRPTHKYPASQKRPLEPLAAKRLSTVLPPFMAIRSCCRLNPTGKTTRRNCSTPC